jgi:hypothetical protein
MSLAEMMTAARPTKAGFTLDVPDSWKQGRTVYGGMSAALCLHGRCPMRANARCAARRSALSAPVRAKWK